MKSKLKIKGEPSYTGGQMTALVVLRLLIGWQFLYEGVAKYFNTNWSSASYLMDSQWIFADQFKKLATDPEMLKIVDALMVWGLIAIGLGLILGVFTRIATVFGILLLTLFYLSHPPLVGLKYAMPMEGSNLIVNKNLIELFALVVLLVFPTGKHVGLDRLLGAFTGNLYEPVKTKDQEKTLVA
jgi:thiosulfate dehydrogenase (quinone) large subunit